MPDPMENAINKADQPEKETEQRSRASEKFVRFLELSGAAEHFEEPADRVDFLRSLTPEQGIEWLKRINGIAREIPIAERNFDGENVQAFGLMPPEQADKEPLLKEAFAAAQKLASRYEGLESEQQQELLLSIAQLLQGAIVIIHPFAEGNGRSSRIIGELFENGFATTEAGRAAFARQFEHGRTSRNVYGMTKFVRACWPAFAGEGEILAERQARQFNSIDSEGEMDDEPGLAALQERGDLSAGELRDVFRSLQDSSGIVLLAIGNIVRRGEIDVEPFLSGTTLDLDKFVASISKQHLLEIPVAREHYKLAYFRFLFEQCSRFDSSLSVLAREINAENAQIMAAAEARMANRAKPGSQE